MDSKSSPLAMLAKTCSQIGADPIPNTSSKNGTNKKSSPDSPLLPEKKDSLSPKIKANNNRSRSSSTEIRVTDATSTVNTNAKKSPALLKSDNTTALTPTVRSGLEVLGHNNAGVSMPPHQPRPLPPSMSYPPSGLANNPFLASFASSSLPEPAAAGSGVCRDPMCRDPLCPTALRNQQQLNFTYSSLLASTPYYKEAIMAFTAAQQRMAAAAALAAAPPGSAGGALPYVCNWVSGKF